MKILIVGLGSIGRRHLKNLYALGLDDFHVLTAGRCPLPTEQLPPFTPEEDLDAALEKQPHAVFICNPTALHVPTALAAARHGCHLFIEKPVSHLMHGLSELLALVREKKLVCQVGFQFRFHEVFRKIKQALADGKIGRIISAHACWGEYLPDWHPWEDYRIGYSARHDLGGGALLTLCHPFDYLRWLVDEVEALHAFVGNSSDLELDTEDAAIVNLRFRNGAIGSVYLDFVSRPSRHTLHIVGTEGWLEWNATCGDAKCYTQRGRAFEVFQPGEFLDRNVMFLAETAHFLDCLHHHRTPDSSLDDGLRALQLVLIAKNCLSDNPGISIPPSDPLSLGFQTINA